LAYLSMMAPRLMELRRVLKSSGSIYLHCDPTASHYLKMLMDSVFGPKNYRNEIIWKRSHAHSKVKRFGPIHDTILSYAKDADEVIWNQIHQPYDSEYVEANFRYRDSDGRRFNAVDMSANNPGFTYEWKGRPPPKGRYWAYAKRNMERLEAEGSIYYTGSGLPREKKYLEEMLGVVTQDIWTDIPPIQAHAAERQGYPTQKPEPLLERIIGASTNEGDTVLDPFCGCGTTIVVAQRLNRRWIGIDITHLAITLIRGRLLDTFGEVLYNVVGEPTDLSGARALAKGDRYQFQWWALGKVGARPTPVEQKKGSDKGIDGRLFFHEIEGGDTKTIILSVKSGGVSSGDLRDLKGVLDRERAQIGVLITLEEPTRDMKEEAASALFYKPEYRLSEDEKYPRIQILTIQEILGGKKIDYPHVRNVTFRKAPEAKIEKKADLKTKSIHEYKGKEDEEEDPGA